MAEEPNVVGDDLGHAGLYALSVLVAAVLQVPLNIERIALHDVFCGRLGQPIPADDRLELRLSFAFDRAAGGHADAGDRLAVLRVPQLGFAVGAMTLLIPRILPSKRVVVRKTYELRKRDQEQMQRIFGL